MQSIECAIRALDKSLMEEKEREARCEKMLADYQEQLGKLFEHESKLKNLLVRQAELNAPLDLDKGARQVAPPAQVGMNIEDYYQQGRRSWAQRQAATPSALRGSRPIC
jgi:hypothetical protein